MKTLEDCKRHVAYSVGHPDWNELLVSLKSCPDEAVDCIFNNLSEMYAKEIAEQYLCDAISALNNDKRVKTILWDNDISIMLKTPTQTP